MKILVTGSTGFIGRHLAAAFRSAGHEVVALVRTARPDAPGAVVGDYVRDVRAETWRPRLAGIDVVVNAVGILRERRGRTFSALHINAPRALFTACADAGVRRVIQISALGADEGAVSRYHVSKANADRHLAALPLDWVVLRPSLVLGLGGASTRLFCSLATLPVVPLVGAGAQRVQPVHIEDLAALCIRLVDAPGRQQRTIDVVGPQVYTVRELLLELRRMLDGGTPRFVRVPRWAARIGALLAGRIPGSALDGETLAMLERGSTADGLAFAATLGRAPRSVVPIVGRGAGGDAWRQALAAWAREPWAAGLMRLSLAFVWIVTGLLSLGLYPVEASLSLLAQTGLAGPVAKIALYVAAALDLLVGASLLVARRRTWVWRAQLALIAGYSAIIAVALPEFLLHPFGPVLKNVALLAMIVVLHETDAGR